MQSPYDIDLDKNFANYQSLTPLTFLRRAANVFPKKTAIIHDGMRISYFEFYGGLLELLQFRKNAVHKLASYFSKLV